jgi:hypothetical protein
VGREACKHKPMLRPHPPLNKPELKFRYKLLPVRAHLYDRNLEKT